MTPHKQILLCCCNELRANELRLVIETRIAAQVTITASLGVVFAVKDYDFHCAVLINGSKEVIDFLRAREIPTLEIGNAPSFADRTVSGSMAEILEAVKIMCTRKRGPKVRKAA